MAIDVAKTKVPLQELCKKIVDCPHSTPTWTDSGVVVLRNQNIRNGRLDLSSSSFTDEEHYQQRIRRAKPLKGDLVITREAPMGEVCEIPDGLRCCLGQRMVLIRPDGNKCSGRYLLYALQSREVRHEILVNEGTGSTVSNLRIPILERLPIPVLSLPEQRAIAHILGTLDDKIEMNRRMNETLEAMARAIFKSWFVDFDPVRAKAEGRVSGLPPHIADLFPDSFEDSELGEIPKGWRVATFEDISVISSGKCPQNRHTLPTTDASIPLWGGNGLIAYVPKSLYNKPILLTGRVGTLGSVFRITSPCWPSDNTLVLLSRDKEVFEFLYLNLERVDFKSLNRGSTQPLLTQSDLKSQLFSFPGTKLLSRFHSIVNSLFEKVDALKSESHALAALRDTLLPKLLSGELRVKDAERFIH
ncbi:MAG: restriction endonuclease subunit S [Candidatus Omnitrophota bacterium]